LDSSYLSISSLEGLNTETRMTEPDFTKHLSQDGLDNSNKALSTLTDAAVTDHSAPPVAHLQAKADTPETQSWIQKHLPHFGVEDLENRYHFGNYVIDRQTGEKSWEAMSVYVRLGMHLLYVCITSKAWLKLVLLTGRQYGSAQAKVLHWKMTEEYLENESRKMGKAYDAPESRDHILPFIESFELEASLPDLIEPDPSKYTTFNEFFSRAIKPEARPIAEPENPNVVSSVADCRLTAFQTVDLATRYWIKGSGFTLGRLLGNDELARYFDGGSIIIHRLAPQDYHRWHAPVSGTVKSVTEIPGSYYTVNPQAINQVGTLDVFCENRRSVMTVERAGTDKSIAIVAVGAMLVGSIIYVDGTEKPGTQIQRGQCLGKFQYGGSTVITVYPKSEVVIDEDLVKNSSEQQCETLVKVGWRLGLFC
jgi:phosphatidylserine decarboxylase